MDDDLEQLLKSLKLKYLVKVLEEELASAEEHGPSYTEFLRRLLRREHTAQQDRFCEYRIRRAKLPERWSLQSYPWDRQPGVDRRVIEQLAELDFVARGANIVFIGGTGVGKTRQDGAGLGDPAQGAVRRLPWALRQGAGPLRRDVYDPG